MKPHISEEIKNIVRKNFTREIEFYQFCRQRLHRQYLALKLPQLKKIDEDLWEKKPTKSFNFRQLLLH